MKKLFTFALAAATLIGFSACSNDEENVLSDKGYINLNVTTDDMVVTRADANEAAWYAVVINGDGSPVFGTTTTKAQIGTTLATTPLNAGEYTVAVSNFPDNDDWLTENGGFGAAYYEGSADNQEVTAGNTTDVNIECGKAKNAKFSVNASGFAGSALSVTINSAKTVKKSDNTETDQNRSMTFTWAQATNTWNHPEAFFLASDENNTTQLNFTISYTINDIPKTSAAKTFTLGTAGSVSTLTIASNQNGTINVIITYDDEFTTGESSTITIDAATGDEI